MTYSSVGTIPIPIEKGGTGEVGPGTTGKTLIGNPSDTWDLANIVGGNGITVSIPSGTTLVNNDEEQLFISPIINGKVTGSTVLLTVPFALFYAMISCTFVAESVTGSGSAATASVGAYPLTIGPFDTWCAIQTVGLSNSTQVHRATPITVQVLGRGETDQKIGITIASAATYTSYTFRVYLKYRVFS